MHTGVEYADRRGRVLWTCCGARASSGIAGCTPCMHASTYEGMQGTVRACGVVRVPKELVLADILPIEKAMIVAEEGGNFSFATNKISASHSAVRKYVPGISAATMQ